MSLPHDISKLGELCTLRLAQLDLGKQSERMLHQICIAILLCLSSNELSLQHATFILDIWKQTCSGKKLKELVLSDNNLKPELLSNIAEHVTY